KEGRKARGLCKIMDPKPILSKCLSPTDIVDHCAHELRQVGDKLYWRYKLSSYLQVFCS
uniref:Uncharacterized protein n=2 Tax=Seriola TaxID=8160 RepID=A0A3B4VR41_SERDU